MENNSSLTLLIPAGIFYIDTDHLGTPQQLTDESGSVVWSAQYEPFGKAAVNEDPDGDGNPMVFNLRFPGQYYDEETGLHYNYFRDYDPNAGRYIESDPIGLAGGLNTYTYVGGDPLSYTDPTGMIFGFDTGESYGDAAVDYWAKLQAKTGNPLYAIPGTLAEMWTPCHSDKTFLSLVPGLGAGRGLAALTRGLSNSIKGAIGETASLINNWLKGSRLLDTQTRIPGYRTIVDSSWRSITGAVYYVESKFGLSTLSQPQRAAAAGLGDLYHVERFSYDAVRNVGVGLGSGTGAVAGMAINPCDCSGN